jgi:signal recognition particle receptor subunit beta
MNIAPEIVRTASTLHLDAASLPMDRRGIVTLVAAAAELLRHCSDDRDDGHAFQTLLAWARTAQPDAHPRAVRHIANAAAFTRDPQWIATFHCDIEGSAHFPQSLVLAGLLATLPPGRSHLEGAWKYVTAAAEHLGIPGEVFEVLHGWLTASASAAVARQAEALVAATRRASAASAAVADALMEHAARALRDAAPIEGPPFPEVRARVIERVEEVLRHADALGVETNSLERLKAFAERDDFRIVVYGEFNRGKSTLVNAFIETPDFMPADILPSTSALTEVRHGETRRFSRWDKANHRYALEDEARFREQVARASEDDDDERPAEERAKYVDRWRVEIPNPFLHHAHVCLVDSPGVGEDRSRDEIAKHEAQIADAAILVFNAKSISSEKELNAVKSLEAKLENLVIAINQSDLVAESDWPRLREHVRKRLKKHGVPIPDERIVFVSAKLAEEAVRSGTRNDPWMTRFSEFRSVVQEHVLARRGVLKARALAALIRDAIKGGRRQAEAAPRALEAKIANLSRLEDEHRAARRARDEALRDIDAAASVLRGHRGIAHALTNALLAELDGILQSVGARKGEWTSQHNPLNPFRSKEHVNDVAEQAKRAVEQAIKSWFKGPGEARLAELLNGKLDDAVTRVERLRAYVEMVRGEAAQSKSEFAESLKTRALENAFESATRGAVDVNAFGRSLILAVASLVTAYIVVDIILFYVLNVIASFIALPLIIGTVVAGVLLGRSHGKDWAENWIQTKVFEQIQKGFSEDESKRKLENGIDDAMREVCSKLALGFSDSCTQIVTETDRHRDKVRAQLEDLKKEGDQSSLTALLTLARTRSESAMRAFDELARVADDVAPAEAP